MDADYEKDKTGLEATPTQEPQEPQRHRRPLWVRLLKWTGITVLALIVLIVAGLCGLTWWLTPERLTEIVNREASEELNADVRTANVRFTFWSTFPHLRLEMDSVSLRSRNFDSIPASVRTSLSADASRLLTAGRTSGGINVIKLFGGQIWLRDVSVDSLQVNLVAANDSLNNYDIIPATSGKHRVPYFNIDGLRIRGDGTIRYTSVPSNTVALVKLSGASLLPGNRRDLYSLRILGDVSARSGQLTILNDFPFELDGDVHIRFKPFGISTNDYRVALGHTDGHMSMSINFGDDISLDNFDYRLYDFNLTDLLKFLPVDDYPVLKHLSANLKLQCSARLTSPYNFSSAYLPSVEVDFSVPEGEVSYTLSDRERYDINNVSMSGRLVFNGRNPELSYVEIPNLSLRGLGASAELNARVIGLTSEPAVSAEVQAEGDLAAMSRRLRWLKPYGLGGDLGVTANVGFRIADNTIYGSLLNIHARANRLTMDYGKCHLELRGLDASTSEKYAAALTGGAAMNEIPVDVKISAKGFRLDDPKDSVTFHCAALSGEGSMSRRGDGAVMRRFDLHFRSDGAHLASHGEHFDIKGLGVRLAASRMAKPVVSPEFKTPAAWSADARTLGFAAHSPEFIQLHASPALRKIMAQWRTKLDVKIKNADISSPTFTATNTLSDLDLTASFDSLLLRSAHISSGDTHVTLSGRLANLRQFLTSATPAPLVTDLNVSIDTVQINQLARAYTASHPHSAIASGDKQRMAQGVDSVAYIIPRNLFAHIHASADETRYINLHLNNLMTDIHVANGVASIDTLHIGSDFGHAGLNLTYNTADLQNIRVDANVNISDINIVNFFANFHKLLDMFPQMANLSGMLSAHIDGHMLMFPNNYINMPSLWANAQLEGWNLKVHQNHFIRHLTRMLMMPGTSDLRIKDMKIHAGVHNDLLEVFPFHFEVGNYRLNLEGLNNFNGDMFYHIGVEDWPLKVPFGINIKGHYHEPVLRFGGKDWHDRNGARITIGVEGHDRVNIVKEMRKYLREFVHTAATYDGE